MEKIYSIQRTRPQAKILVNARRFILACLLMTSYGLLAQTTVTLTPASASPWTVPAGVTAVSIQAWGGGGAGGASNSNNNGGSGGGGGAYSAQNAIAVTPGQSINFTVGSGGTAAQVTTAAAGGNTSILGLFAGGGGGGIRTSTSSPGGAGGTASGGTFNTNGANGGIGGNNSGGDGGNSPNGGNGGNGVSNGNGQAGTAPGGGGGGGEYVIGNRTGGNGGDGRITITYLIPTISALSTANACPGTTITISGTNFTTATAVTFNGIAAAGFTVLSATQISAVVPVGPTTGPVRVTLPGGYANSGNFTIFPKPAVAAISGNPTLCIGQSTVLSSATSGGSWTSSNTAVATVNASGTVDALSAGTANITYSLTNSNGCTTAVTFAVNVYGAAPSLLASTPSQTVCSGSAVSFNVNAAGDGLVYQWYQGVMPLTDGGAVSGANSATLTLNPVAVSHASADYHCEISGYCAPAVISPSAALAVNEQITIVTQPDAVQTVCENATVQFSVAATGSGLSYQWYDGAAQLNDGAGVSGSSTSTLTLDPVSIAQASSSYHCIVSGISPCGTVDSSMATLIVTQVPVIVADPVSLPAICSGAAANFTVSATGGALSYQWFNGPTPIVNSANVSGADTASLLINPTAMGDSSANYHCVVSNGCGTATSASAALVVNQTPVIPDQAATICSDDTFSVSPLNAVPDASVVVPTGTTYSWSAPAMTPGLSGGFADSGQTSISQTLNNATNSAQTATYLVTPYAGTTGNCAGIPFTVTVTVLPKPFIVNLSQSACSGTNFSFIPTNGSGNIVPSGTTFSWGLPVLSGSVTGATAGSGLTSINQTLYNVTGALQTATYTVTATSGSCLGATFNVVVNIYSTPTVAGSPASQTVCSSGSISGIALSNPNNVPGPIDYSWTRDNTANVTGIAASGFGNLITGSLTNLSSVPQTVTFTLYASSEYGCVSNPTTVTVLVNPSPTVSAGPATQSICSGNAITPVNITNPNSVSGVSYNWTRDNNVNLTGIAASGTSSSITGTLTNTTNTVQTATFTIWTEANGCPSATSQLSVTVNPRPTVSASPTSQSVCSNTPIAAISLANPNAVAGTTFSWTRNNTAAVTGIAASGSGSTISGTLLNTTNSVQVVTFTVTATSGGCASAVTTAQVTVLPSAILSITPASQNLCTNSNISTITFNNTNAVAGISYSWTRTNTAGITGLASSGTGNTISGTVVNATATTQSTTITMTATAPNGCVATATAVITVYAPVAAPVIGNSQTVCVLSTPGAITQTTAVSGGSGVYTYQWQSSADGLNWVNIAGANTASYTPPFVGFATDNTFYRLVVSNLCGSVTSNSVYVEVVSNVGFTFDVDDGIAGPANTICSGSSFTPDISAIHFAGSAVRYSWTTTGSNITPASGGPVGTTSNAFLGLRTSSANIGPLTGVNNGNASVTVQVSITPSVYNYPGPPSGSFICSVTPQVFNVTIRPRPAATIVSPANNTTICSGTSPNITVSGNITDEPMYYVITRSVNASVSNSVSFPYTTPMIAPGATYTFPNILTNISAADHPIVFTITPYSSSGCAGTPVTITIIVARNTTPGSIGANHSVCLGGDPSLLTQVTAATGNSLSYQWYSSTVSATGPWTMVSGATGTTYDPPAGLMQTTWYIRELTSTLNSVACNNILSNAVQVSVNNINVGSVNGNQTICSGDDPAAFTIGTAATATGTLSYLWESSTTGCSGPWSSTGVASAVYDPAPLTQTTYYRRRVTTTIGAQSCTEYNNCIAVTVNHVSGGTVGSDETLCGNNPSAFTQITPSTGSGTLSYQWQSNTTGCSGAWTNIPGAIAAVYDPPAGVTQTTYYRRMTTSTLNGKSCVAYSNCITVTANPVTAGAIGANRTVCFGGDPAAFTQLVAATGTALTYQWQVSTVSAAGPWTDITGANSATYDAPGPIVQTTWFQRVVTGTINSVGCSVASNSVTVFVNDVTAPVIAGDQAVCSEDPAAFTIVTAATFAGAGSYQWQSSTTGCGGPWTNIVGASAPVYDPPVVSQTTYYRVIVSSLMNAVSCTAISNCITVTSNAKTWNGSAGSNWNTAANWTPPGVPTSSNCIVIPAAANNPVVTGTAFVGYGFSLTVLNGGNLSVSPGNSLEITDYVNVNAGGTFFIADDAALVQLNNVNNSGIVNIQRITPPVYRFDYTYWNSPVTLSSNYTLGNLSPNTQVDKYYSWNPSVAGGNGNWNQESVATIMNPNRGYIVRAPNGYSNNPAITAPYTAVFTGTPNNGDFLTPVIIGSLGAGTVNDKLNLIGNPYPSAVDADLWLNDPANVNLLEGTIYFWTHHSPPAAAYPNPFYGNFTSNYTASDYATYTTGMGGTSTVPSGYGGAAPTGFLATGQSFFVKALSSGNVVFRNSMRVRGNNDNFFRPANTFTSVPPNAERERIWLNLANQQGAFSQLMLGYAQDATDGRDRNYDGETFAGNAVSFYSLLNGGRFTIQGVALPFEASDVFPLGYKATISATFTIGIDHLDTFFDDRGIYLHDKLLDVMHDLKAAPYSFSSAAGVFDERFELRFADELLHAGTPETVHGLEAYIADGTLHVQASESMLLIELFDIGGKKIAAFEPDGNRYERMLLLPQGVYIAKVTTRDGFVQEAKLMN